MSTLVYYDEPQIVLLSRSDDRKIIGVAIQRDGFEYPFLGAEIDVKQWHRYMAGFVDLRYLFLFPHFKRWYLFDIVDTGRDEVNLITASEDIYRNHSYLPEQGFFYYNHTEEGPDCIEVPVSVQQFYIDGMWDLPDFSQFYGKFTDLYVFFLALKKVHAHGARLDLQTRIRNAFFDHPLRGGFSYVNLYGDLSGIQEAGDRLAVKEIQYASPGQVIVRGREDVFQDIAASLSVIEEKYEDIKCKYNQLHSFLSKNDLLKAEAGRFDQRGALADHINRESHTIADMLNFAEFPHVHELSGQNSLLSCKVLLAHFRRLERYYMFFAEGRVRALEPNDA